MHNEPYALTKVLSEQFPYYFNYKRILEVGSLDINGSVRQFFHNCQYIGLDVGEGKGVDVICPIEDYHSEEKFDVVISTEMLEHAVNWKPAIQSMLDNLKSGGILIFTCAGPTRQEHGTSRTTAGDSPYTNDYYENRTIEDLRSVWKEELFEGSNCYYLRGEADLLFWGVKKIE